MATKLLKEISREYRQGNETYIVTLNPDCTITFRKKGYKTRFSTALAGCYNLAIICQAEMTYRDKMEEYNRRVKLGVKGLRKPKRPSIASMFHPKYTKAMTI